MSRFAFVLSVLSAAVMACLNSASAASVAKWERFEVKLESSANHTNPVQQAALTATFTSPSGKAQKVYGFWDGERTWKVRFAPNETGKWTYKTECSDSANRGLHGQTGDFTCTDARGDSRFAKHGPVRVAPDGRSLYQDGWLPDL